MGFFSYDPVPDTSPYFLEQFSFPHVVAIGVLLALVCCVIGFRRRLVAWKGERTLRMSVMAFAILCELSLHIFIGVQRGWIEFVTNTIPLDLCAISFWLSVTATYCTSGAGAPRPPFSLPIRTARTGTPGTSISTSCLMASPCSR